MDDMERYGDYNEVDEVPEKKSVVGLILRILVAVVCIGVAGILVFRMVIANYYPDNMKNIYFNDTLLSYYEKTDGNIGAKTQELRAMYDDPDEGNFFCDNLIVIEGAGQLQITLRYNVSVFENLKTKHKLDLSPDAKDNFKFRLVTFDDEENSVVLGELSDEITEEAFMYRYHKLVFDGVNFGTDGAVKPSWIRLEVMIDEYSEEKPFAMIAIYENNEVYNSFNDYVLSDSEVPNK